jgi:hypothetical protein
MPPSPVPSPSVEIGRHRSRGHELAPGFVLMFRDDDTDDEHATPMVDGMTAVVAYDDRLFGVQVLTVPQRLSRNADMQRIDVVTIQHLTDNAAVTRRIASVLPTLQAAWAH